MTQLELIQKNLQPLRLDAMPAEVATASLTTPGAKMPGAFRRTCHYARASYYVSCNAPKPIEDKLARHFSSRPIDRLIRQLRRTERKIRRVGPRPSGVLILLGQHYKAILLELQRRASNIFIEQTRKANATQKHT